MPVAYTAKLAGVFPEPDSNIYLPLIMLNYLIAVISSAYERVVMQREIYQYTHKAEINLDYFQIIS